MHERESQKDSLAAASPMAVPHVRRRRSRQKTIFFTRNAVVAMMVWVGILGTLTWARPASVPSSALLNPSAVDGGAGDAESLLLGSPTPVSGQISFRTKTRHGVLGACGILLAFSLCASAVDDDAGKTASLKVDVWCNRNVSVYHIIYRTTVCCVG